MNVTWKKTQEIPGAFPLSALCTYLQDRESHPARGAAPRMEYSRSGPEWQLLWEKANKGHQWLDAQMASAAIMTPEQLPDVGV